MHFTFQSLVPVRAQAADASEMVTQLLFGELVEVVARDRQWLQVHVAPDGYTGWIDEKMVLEVDAAWHQGIQGWEYVLEPSLALTCTREGTSLPLHLSLGARIPRWTRDDLLALPVTIGDWQLQVRTAQVCHYERSDVAAILDAAQRYLGAPYLWGGKSIWGIDCSGFVQMVFGMCGIQLPRDAAAQALVGTEVSFEQRRAGDLAFFVNASGKIHHVGLVLPDGNIRHASGHVHDASLESTGIVGKYTGVQTHTLCNIKRIV
jgi:gamma-D-glutamyl-L-lysine dipeptidyl-peptidase